MKKKELQDYRKKSFSEIEKAIRENHERLAVLKFDLAAGKIKNIREIKETKRTIAQLLTILNERKIET